MNALLLGMSAVIAAGTEGAEEKCYQHCFAPKAFYRHHNEIGYKYDTVGIGLQYHLKRDEGVNVKLSVITNPQEKNVLTESENTLLYKINMEKEWNLYPIFSHRSTTHHVPAGMYPSRYIHKKTFYAGIGAETFLFSNWQGRIELQGFRDLYNATFINDAAKYWGTLYSNPYGARAKVGLSTFWANNKAFMEVDAYYGKTFRKCYEEVGCELAINWAF